MKYILALIFFFPFMLKAQSHNQTGRGGRPGPERVGAPPVFTYVEKMPDFPGGVSGYLSHNLIYPATAKAHHITGRVVVRFLVRDDGTVDSAHIITHVDPALDAEALRVINHMPKWKPGMQNGKPVTTYFTLPINFEL